MCTGVCTRAPTFAHRLLVYLETRQNLGSVRDLPSDLVTLRWLATAVRSERKSTTLEATAGHGVGARPKRAFTPIMHLVRRAQPNYFPLVPLVGCPRLIVDDAGPHCVPACRAPEQILSPLFPLGWELFFRPNSYYSGSRNRKGSDPAILLTPHEKFSAGFATS